MDRYTYRAKRKDNGKWIYGVPIRGVFVKQENQELITYIFSFDELDYDSFADFEDDFGYYEVDPFTLCQCTGVPDKNGNMIYEWDIVFEEFSHLNRDHVRTYWTIVYKENYGAFTALCNDKRERYLTGGDFEIIGSYIDNPELLEEENESK